MIDRQVAAFRANAGAIAIGHASTLQGEVSHDVVVAADHEERLAAAGLVGEDRTGPVTLYGQVVLGDEGTIVILPIDDVDGVARPGRSDGRAGCCELLSRTRDDRPCGRMVAQKGDCEKDAEQEEPTRPAAQTGS
ncbi:hypothetical protein [Lichenicola sp.]|uniref:hypothetical protein n=1 Tax=Lichenicola sp. TaxID=2804529 RepID=UPI003B0007E1